MTTVRISLPSVERGMLYTGIKIKPPSCSRRGREERGRMSAKINEKKEEGSSASEALKDLEETYNGIIEEKNKIIEQMKKDYECTDRHAKSLGDLISTHVLTTFENIEHNRKKFEMLSEENAKLKKDLEGKQWK